jgi:hypothetical protein
MGAPAATLRRGHVKPRLSVSVSSRRAGAPNAAAALGWRWWGPGASVKKLGACAAIALVVGSSIARTLAQVQTMPPKAPVVALVGCAGRSASPHIWSLSHASQRTESSRAGISTSETEQFGRRALGQGVYQLIGVADFVDAETSRTIGARRDILSPARVNVTGMLVSGHKVAVKGLYIEGSPPRINLTSVVDLGVDCP